MIKITHYCWMNGLQIKKKLKAVKKMTKGQIGNKSKGDENTKRMMIRTAWIVLYGHGQ